MPPEDPILRLVRVALSEPNPTRELTSALRKLLPPRRVRRLLGSYNDGRMAIATAVAEQALGPTLRPELASELSDVLGVTEAAAAAAIAKHRHGEGEKHPDGVRSEALALVGEIEGLSGRIVRERIRGERFAANYVRRQLKRRYEQVK